MGRNALTIVIITTIVIMKIMVIMIICSVWYHLYNFENVKKNPWRSVTFSKVAVDACNK